MSPTDTLHLGNFLKLTEAERLGEGDVVAGANLLAAMAISLANIQRPGSGLINRNDDTITAGTSLLVSGSHSCSLITERVITGLGTRQNNLIARLRQMPPGTSDRPAPRTQPGSRVFDQANQANQLEYIFEQLCQPGAIMDQQATESWGAVLQVPVRTNIRYLQDHPTIFVTGTKVAELTEQFEHCHLGHPLVHLGIDSVGDFTRYEHLGPAVMDGRTTVGAMAENIRGAMVVTDPTGLLDEAVRNGLSSARWANRMCWLVDGNSGPELDDADDAGQPVLLGGVERRFETAMGLAWGRRVSDRESGPLMMDFEFTESQAAWSAFLIRLEPAFPGLTGTARSLFVTLWFGLQQMVDAVRTPAAFSLSEAQVLALAKLIVHRMVNARAVMVRAAETTRREQLEISIINKLAGGPLSLRDLNRKFYRLPSAMCHERLLDLEAAGKVAKIGSQWQLARAGLLTVTRDREWVIEA